MRRLITVPLMAAMLLSGASATALAQYETHPNVGTWFTSLPDGEGIGSIVTIGADGTVRAWTPNGPGIGTWEPTGDTTFATTIAYPSVDPESGAVGITTVRIEGEASADGTTASGTYTLEFPAGPEGAGPPPGEFGPVPFASTKMAVEAMGEPVDTWPPSAAE